MATPEYAAPEILAGADPSPASDVYSLGAVLRNRLGDTGSGPADALISQTLAPEPSARPSAAELAEQLTALPPLPVHTPAATTRAVPAGSTPADSTAELPIAVQQEMLAETRTDTADEPIAEPTERRRFLPVALVLAFLLAAFAIAAAVASDDEPGLDDVAIATTTTTPVTTSTAAPEEVTATTVPVETTASLEDDVGEVVTLIEDTPRNVLKKKEGEDIIERVVDGVSSALSGSADKAEEELRDAVKTINDKLDSDRIAEQARSLIRRIGIRLGLNPDEIVEDDSES